MVRFRPVVAEVPLPLPLPLPLLLPLLLPLQPARASASTAHVAAATSTRVDRLPCRFITFLSLGAARMMGAGRGCHSDADVYRRCVSLIRIDSRFCSPAPVLLAGCLGCSSADGADVG